MITLEMAKNKLQTEKPNLKVISGKFFKGKYVFLAFSKNYLEIDPFYSIDASSGEIGNFNPIEDITFFDTFYKK